MRATTLSKRWVVAIFLAGFSMCESANIPSKLSLFPGESRERRPWRGVYGKRFTWSGAHGIRPSSSLVYGQRAPVPGASKVPSPADGWVELLSPSGASEQRLSPSSAFEAQPSPTCTVPEFGPRTENVTVDSSTGRDHNELQEEVSVLRAELIYTRGVRDGYIAWYNAVRSCFADSDRPSRNEVEGQCLFDVLSAPFCNTVGEAFCRRQLGATFGTNSWIVENEQYLYQCQRTCNFWVNQNRV